MVKEHEEPKNLKPTSGTRKRPPSTYFAVQEKANNQASVSTRPSPYFHTVLIGLRDKFLAIEESSNIGLHTLSTLLALGSFWLIHIMLNALLGKDAKFFDLIPIRYVIDSGDLVVLLRFLWHLMKRFRE
jgi:hypothetical protein